MGTDNGVMYLDIYKYMAWLKSRIEEMNRTGEEYNIFDYSRFQ